MNADRLSRFNKLPGEARIGLSDVCELLGRHRQSLWRYVRDGRMPRPQKILGGRPTWSVNEIRSVLKGGQ